MTALQTEPETTTPIRIEPAPADSQERPEFLAHHFDTPRQQFEAAKLGMWLFLATEVLLFGGLFCVYAIFRGNHPEMFEYASQFLDTRWGVTNTAVLLISSMTMALAVTAAQRGRQRQLIALLLATFMGGAVFMSVKYIEYSHKFHENIYWGTSYYQKPHWLLAQEEYVRNQAQREAESAPVFVADIEKGIGIWMATCRSCHGVVGEGVAGQGVDQRGSEFITSKTDAQLVAFISEGRLPSDPLSKTGMQMPSRGGNPLLSDEDLYHVVAYVRTFDPAPSDKAGATEIQQNESGPDKPVEITKSVIPDATSGPAGFDVSAYEMIENALVQGADPEPVKYPHHTVDPDRPANTHLFFGIYFLMTGLHGIHVLGGMALIAWLTVGAIRGRYGPQYFTPVDLGGLYWHVVDIIWIFLFPLLYLIS